MTTGQYLVTAGFVLGALATAFLSWDLLNFEDDVMGILNRVFHAIKLQESAEETRRDTPVGAEAGLAIGGQTFGEIDELLTSAAEAAAKQTNKQTADKVDIASTKFEHKKSKLMVAIVLVAIGGILDLIGQLRFHA